jgi:uracil-DNA glycosylase
VAVPAAVAAVVPVVPAMGPVPADWTALQAAVAACRNCRLCETRTNTVFGVGPRGAPLMVVGEGPGADEDAQGEPFVGRAGKLLDEMLRAIGRSRRSDTFIANVVKCRPPGNREPAEDEAEACRGYLEQQLQLVKPRLIVALGRIAAQRLLATDTPIGKMRGQTYQWGPAGTPLMVTYHPAYLLRNPGDKAKSWEDLKRIHRFLASP